MHKIIPHLWFDKESREAADFYATAFPDSRVTSASVLHGTPSGDCDVVSFEVMGQPIMSISAGPYFKLNPSISFMINFDPSKDPEAAARIDEIWNKLIAGGQALMPLGEYPFSKRYGWVQDRFGVSWQLILTNPAGEERPRVIPSFLFTNAVSGRAKEATDFYLSVFKDSKRGALALFPEDTPVQKKGDVMFTDFMLEGQWFVAMDGGNVHDFGFNEALSLLVSCDTQEEIDFYTDKLSAAPEAEQCGWLKDRYGVSWQINPRRMDEMMRTGTPEQVERVTKAFLQMKRFDIAALERAFAGE